MAEEEKEKKKGKKKFIIIALALAILGGGGFFGYKFFFAKKDKKSVEEKQTIEKVEKKENKGEKGKSAEEEKEVVTQIVSLPTILVNLADPLGRRYLKVSISLEIKGKDTPSLIEKDTPQIKDSLILLLSSKTFEDLNSFEKKIALKKEIVKRINQILGKSVIRRVYFTEFIIQ